MTERLSNTELGGLIGVSHASVSRIRSGDRKPSIRVMSKISKLTGWSIDGQVASRDKGTYAIDFEQAFSEYSEDSGVSVPTQRSTG